MSLVLEVQFASDAAGLPSRENLETWARTAASGGEGTSGLVIRIVDEAEGRRLNHAYRGRDRATNVLSFPFEPPPGVPPGAVGDHLGDLVVCAPVVHREALEQRKAPEAHWAHMVVHGVLHLLGYDHQNDADAALMEDREREILRGLGYPDPYRTAGG